MAKKMKKPKIGIALGGGGVRGFAHIGIIEVIEREFGRDAIQFIVGTSAGAIVGAMYASGMSIEDMRKIASEFHCVYCVQFLLYVSRDSNLQALFHRYP